MQIAIWSQFWPVNVCAEERVWTVERTACIRVSGRRSMKAGSQHHGNGSLGPGEG